MSAGWALVSTTLSDLYNDEMLQPLDKLLPLLPALSAYWQDIPRVGHGSGGGRIEKTAG